MAGPDHGRHEMPPAVPAAASGGRSQRIFGVLAAVLCVLLGIAIATQVRQTRSGDALTNARPADLLVLLDSLQQREAALNIEVSELQRNLAAVQSAGSSDQAAIANAQSRLADLSILIGTVAATGPGVTIDIEDPGPGVAPEHREEIFKTYFTTHQKGTGLVLAIVQQIVLAHGWESTCHPNEPRGALFRISHIKTLA